MSGGTGQGPVLVLAGGLSHEREVSLNSGRRVARALAERGHEVITADLDSSLIATLRGIDDVTVFPLLHGETGEDGSLRQVLDLLDVPYVGAGPAASRIAFDKSIATPVVTEAGLLTPEQIALPHDVFRELGAAELVRAVGDRLGFPLMVKPARSGSAMGCSRVEQPAELPQAMVGAYAYGDLAVIESFISGTEVAVGVVDLGSGPEALPAVEIRPDSGVYDYAARYTAGATRFIAPADIDEQTAKACADLAIRVHEVLGLRELSRTDMIISADGVPVFLEANVAPGMTETSSIPLAMKASGKDLGDFCSEMIMAARRRQA